MISAFPRRAIKSQSTDEACISEDNLALKFVAALMLIDEVPFLRYVDGWSRWMRWTGARWQHDDTLAVFERARKFLRDCPEAQDRKVARVLGKAATVAAIERLARCDTACAGRISEWDSDPLVLNTPSGTIDLTTGETGAHSARDFLTKMTAVAPGGDCPRWRTFLSEVTADDRELQEFLARMVGLALTGLTREHALFFIYGTGSNGKGVFLNTLTRWLGDYAAIAPMETFTASPTDRHPTELAMLRGARFVVSQETEEGRRWAESRIKALTGGDPITARFMRGDFFTFEPQFKLVIAGNHKPALRSVDEAIRRRLHLIPFTVTIPPDRRDPGLSDALRTEAPGILQWALEGCLDWQRDGLRPPTRVLDATREYFETQDSLQAWIEDACEIGANNWDLPGVLFKSWSDWAEKAGEHVGNQRSFGDRLESAGYQRKKSNSVRRHDGIAVKFRPTGDDRL